MYNDVLSDPNENHPKCALCNCRINVADFYDGSTEIPICNYCKSTGIFRLDFYEDLFRQNEQIKPAVTPLSVNELRRLTGSKVLCQGGNSTRAPDVAKDRTMMKVIKAPIESTHAYTSPLNYLGYYSGRKRSRLPSLVRRLPNSATISQDVEDVPTTHEVQPPKRLGLRRVSVPVSIKDKEYLKERGVCCSEVFLAKDIPARKASLSEVLPMVHFPVSWEKGEAVNADDDAKVPESSTKKSSSEMIKDLKSQAHKK